MGCVGKTQRIATKFRILVFGLREIAVPIVFQLKKIKKSVNWEPAQRGQKLLGHPYERGSEISKIWNANSDQESDIALLRSSC